MVLNLIFEGRWKNLKFFEKLKQSLVKTRSRFSSNLQLDADQQEKFSDSFFDELEQTLIVADVGVAGATKIINSLKLKIKEKN